MPKFVIIKNVIKGFDISWANYYNSMAKLSHELNVKLSKRFEM